MFDPKTMELVVKVLLIAGAVNWGLIAAADLDIVQALFGKIEFEIFGFTVEKIVKLLVGIAGFLALYALVFPGKAPVKA